MALNARRREFIRQYMKHRNSLLAYQLAGFSGSKLHAIKLASEVLNLPEVKAEIARLEGKLNKKLIDDMHTMAIRTQEERLALATATVDDLFDYSGEDGLPRHKAPKDIPKEALKAVTKVKVTIDPKTGATKAVEYSLSSKDAHLSALEEKYAIMPDNQRIAAKVDVTSGGEKIDTVQDREAVVRGLLADWKARKAAALIPEVGGTPQEGESAQELGSDVPEQG